jgi:hypothetical protein
VKKLAIVISLAAGVVLQPVANAGSAINPPVFINVAGTIVTVIGGVTSTRNTSDSLAAIGCQARLSGGASATSTAIACTATDANGNHAFCEINSPPDVWIQVVSAINASSKIEFKYDTSGGVGCTDLIVSNISSDL